MVDPALLTIVLASLSGLILQIVTFLAQRKLGLLPAQRELNGVQGNLVASLKETVSQQATQIGELKASLDEARELIDTLTTQVDDLKGALADALLELRKIKASH